MKSALLISGLIALSSISIPALGDKYYKWVDRDGVTHYSEKRPANTATTLIRVKASTAKKTDNLSSSELIENSQSTLVENSLITDHRQEQQNSQTQKLTEEKLALQRSNCAKASNKLAALENAGRVRQLDEQSGEYRYLPDSQKLAEISKMRQYLKANCRGR